MRSLAVVMLMAGCGDNRSIPAHGDAGTGDAGLSFTYRLRLVASEPADRAPTDPKPVAMIDGIASDELVQGYPDLAAAVADVHHVELRQGATVIASRDIGPSAATCMPNGTITAYTQGICEFDSGDLRFGSETVTGNGGTCVGDGFCAPACNCGPTERCTSRIVLETPLSSHLGCAPVGPRTVGQPCALVADPAGAYDDCGADLLCVGGTCQPTCDPRMGSHPCATGTCTFVPGHAPDLGVCQ
jgi:hypothetical protein